MSRSTEKLERFWNWTTFSPWFPVVLIVAMVALAVVFAVALAHA